MNQEELETAFDGGLLLTGGTFWPSMYLARVDEPDFGCEDRPAQGIVYGKAYGADRSGPREWQIEERTLWSSGLDDQMWVGRWQDGWALLAKDADKPKSLTDEQFQQLFG